MKLIRLPFALAATTVALGTLFTTASAVDTTASTASTSPSRSLVDRGAYLVNSAGLCADCHSPRNERGEFLAGKHLAGAPIGFKPLAPMPWMPAAPRLAGGPDGFNEEQLVQFLMNGSVPAGRPPALPPMPAYRFDRADAEAITAYLRSLPVRGAQ